MFPLIPICNSSRLIFVLRSGLPLARDKNFLEPRDVGKEQVKVIFAFDFVSLGHKFGIEKQLKVFCKDEMKNYDEKEVNSATKKTITK